MTDQELLAEIGAALAGPEWRSWMAEALGVNRTTVHRWLTGYSRIPPGVWQDIARLADNRAATLGKLAPLLRARADQEDET